MSRHGSRQERVLAEFAIASEPGAERDAIARVAEAVAGQRLPLTQLERLKTAVAEAAMNAIEHGNRNRAELEVGIRVTAFDGGIAVTITDHGSGPSSGAVLAPDLDEKLAGLQSPRGWGLFLIRNMVDAMDESTVDGAHVLRLVIHLDSSVPAADGGRK
jgi:anti-sigma regulatory factor (Ser/Thr protein kinase)